MTYKKRGRDMAVSHLMFQDADTQQEMEGYEKCLEVCRRFQQQLVCMCARTHRHTATQPHTNFKYSLPFLFVQDVLAPWFPHLIVLFCAHFFYCSNYLISDYRRYRRWGFFCRSSRVSFYSRKAGRDSGFFSLGHILRYIGQKPASSSVFFFFLVSLSPTSYCVWCTQSLLSHLSITFQTNYVQMCCMFD